MWLQLVVLSVLARNRQDHVKMQGAVGMTVIDLRGDERVRGVEAAACVGTGGQREGW